MIDGLCWLIVQIDFDSESPDSIRGDSDSEGNNSPGKSKGNGNVNGNGSSRAAMQALLNLKQVRFSYSCSFK